MHRIHFYKYEGAGNDFVVIDNRRGLVRRDDEALIRQLCDRRFGIGADGLLLLEDCAAYDFEMVYFNADGREGSMCGNGGRCAASFAHYLGITGDPVRFLAVDGEHEAWVEEGGAWVELRMGSVESVEKGPDYYFLDTGSPHYVVFVDDLAGVDVVRRGRELRYSDRFRDAGTNVNFVQALESGIAVATYERGVEDETLSCGTGVTASAMAYYLRRPGPGRQRVDIRTRGGELQVRFRPKNGAFADVWLCGPARRVFEGWIEAG